MKEENYKKEINKFNHTIYLLQTENKSLKDKVILLEVKLNSEPKFNLDNNEF